MPALNQTVCALRFFYGVTLGHADIPERIAYARAPRTLPVVLSTDEVVRFLEAVPSLKTRTALTTAYAAGLRASEAIGLKVDAIDSGRGVIRVEHGKGRKDRYVMLSARLLAFCGSIGGWQSRRTGCFPVVAEPRRSMCRFSVRPAARPCRSRHRQARDGPYAAAQLRHASLGERHRHPHYPGPARKGDILPTNTWLKGGSTTGFIPDAARPC
ncbi:hypothetical protein GCM10007937_58110 [Mesorhizobium albiziae]|nr:hypothetical protein GCM10007937_58110 [Mesorhizobium albiziae]